MSIDESILFSVFSVDATVLRVEDIYQRETQNRAVLQNLDWRLQRLEDLNMNMYEAVQKVLNNQSGEEQDRSSAIHRQTSWFDDDIHDRRLRRRRSSLTAYELNGVKDKFISKSTTTIMNRLSKSKHGLSILDPSSVSKKINQIPRRSTVHRLDSITSNDLNMNRLQSNEYTTITDGNF